MGGSWATPICSNSTFDSIDNYILTSNTKNIDYGFRIATINDPYNIGNMCSIVDKYNISESGTINSSYSRLYQGSMQVSGDNLVQPGKVKYDYKIGKYPVTNNEYALFLNAVAKTDTFGLWAVGMGSSVRGGISRTGSPGAYVYKVKNNMGNKPVIYVSFRNAMRYVNWLSNGKPNGAQNSTTTEAGAYDVYGNAVNNYVRNLGYLPGLEPTISGLTTQFGSGTIFSFGLTQFSENLDTWRISDIITDTTNSDSNYKYGELLTVNTSTDTVIARPAQIRIITKKEPPLLKLSGNATSSISTHVINPYQTNPVILPDIAGQPSFKINSIVVTNGGDGYAEGQAISIEGMTARDIIENNATLIAHTKKNSATILRTYIDQSIPNGFWYVTPPTGSGAIISATLQEVQHKGLYNNNTAYEEGSIVYITGNYWIGEFKNFYRKIDGISTPGQQPASPVYDGYGRLYSWSPNPGWVDFNKAANESSFGSRWVVSDVNIVDGGENYSLSQQIDSWWKNSIKITITNDGTIYSDFLAIITEVSECDASITKIDIISGGSYAKDSDVLEFVEITDGGSYFRDSGSLNIPQRDQPVLTLSIDAPHTITTAGDYRYNYHISQININPNELFDDRGVFDPNSSYDIGAVVSYGGPLYKRILNPNILGIYPTSGNPDGWWLPPIINPEWEAFTPTPAHYYGYQDGTIITANPSTSNDKVLKPAELKIHTKAESPNELDYIEIIDGGLYYRESNNKASIIEVIEPGSYHTVDASSAPEGSSLASDMYYPKYFLPNSDEWYKAAFYDPHKNGTNQPGYHNNACRSSLSIESVCAYPNGDGNQFCSIKIPDNNNLCTDTTSITLGYKTYDTSLVYTGNGCTTNRSIILGGSTGGGIINSSGSGPLILRTPTSSLSNSVVSMSKFSSGLKFRVVDPRLFPGYITGESNTIYIVGNSYYYWGATTGLIFWTGYSNVSTNFTLIPDINQYLNIGNKSLTLDGTALNNEIDIISGESELPIQPSPLYSSDYYDYLTGYKSTLQFYLNLQSSTLSLIKKGSGSWKLKEYNTYSGNTSILDGSLILSKDSPNNGSKGSLGSGDSSKFVLLGDSLPNTRGEVKLLLDNNSKVDRKIIIAPLGNNSSQLVYLGGVNASGFTKFSAICDIVVQRNINLICSTGGTVIFNNNWINFNSNNNLTYNFTLNDSNNSGTIQITEPINTTGSMIINSGAAIFDKTINSSDITISNSATLNTGADIISRTSGSGSLSCGINTNGKVCSINNILDISSGLSFKFDINDSGLNNDYFIIPDNTNINGSFSYNNKIDLFFNSWPVANTEYTFGFLTNTPSKLNGIESATYRYFYPNNNGTILHNNMKYSPIIGISRLSISISNIPSITINNTTYTNISSIKIIFANVPSTTTLAPTTASPTTTSSPTAFPCGIISNITIPYPDSESNSLASYKNAGIITLGAGAKEETLKYTGSGCTIGRGIIMMGSTGDAIIDSSGTGPLSIIDKNIRWSSKPPLNGGVDLSGSIISFTIGTKNLVLTGSNKDNNNIGTINPIYNIYDDRNEQIPHIGLIKKGSGTWILNGSSNKYNNGTKILDGTLMINEGFNFYSISTSSPRSALGIAPNLPYDFEAYDFSIILGSSEPNISGEAKLLLNNNNQSENIYRKGFIGFLQIPAKGKNSTQKVFIGSNQTNHSNGNIGAAYWGGGSRLEDWRSHIVTQRDLHIVAKQTPQYQYSLTPDMFFGSTIGSYQVEPVSLRLDHYYVATTDIIFGSPDYTGRITVTSALETTANIEINYGTVMLNTNNYYCNKLIVSNNAKFILNLIVLDGILSGSGTIDVAVPTDPYGNYNSYANIGTETFIRQIDPSDGLSFDFDIYSKYYLDNDIISLSTTDPVLKRFNSNNKINIYFNNANLINTNIYPVGFRTSNDISSFVNYFKDSTINIFIKDNNGQVSHNDSKYSLVSNTNNIEFIALDVSVDMFDSDIPNYMDSYDSRSSNQVTAIKIGSPANATTTLPPTPENILILDMEGSSLVDSSYSPKTINIVGNAIQSSVQSKFGSQSLFLDGSNSGLDIISTGIFAVSDDDWTIELWAYPKVTNNQSLFFITGNSYGTIPGLVLYLTSDGKIALSNASQGDYEVRGGSYVLNIWQHFAVVHYRHYIYLYHNGIRIGKSASTLESSGSGYRFFTESRYGKGYGNNFLVGYGGVSPFQGYIDHIIYKKNLARYTTNFTPIDPLAPTTTTTTLPPPTPYELDI